MKVCSTLIEPRIVVVPSKTEAGVFHEVIPTTIWNDSLCTCKGWHFKGTCSHSRELDELACDWAALSSDLTECPKCGAPVIEFDPEPTYDLES